MDTFETITCELAGPTAMITLNRPETRNAMSNGMVQELLSCFHELATEAFASVRIAVLRAAGTVFSAGGDLRDLQIAHAPEEKLAAIARLDELLQAVNQAPQVVIARVQGAAMGGGLGLVCVSDIAIASASATFALPEVRLGLAPSVISPYVVDRVGFTRARQLMLTGREVDATAACEYGLVHMISSDEDLDHTVGTVIGDILKGAPQALRECKRLLFRVSGSSNAETLTYRVALLNQLRAGEEAQQGMLSFIQKRPAPWVKEV